MADRSLRSLSRFLLSLILCVPVLCSAQEPPAAVSPDALVPNGEGRFDPGRDPAFARMATLPWRPEWAPLPLLYGEDAPLSMLRGLLSATAPEDRARSCLLLGQIADPSAPSALRPMLADPSRTVRVHAGMALALLGQGDGLPVCEAVLEADPPWVRYLAVHALWRLGTDRARMALARHQIGQDPLVARAIAGALTTPSVAPPPPGTVRDTSSDGITPQEIWERAADAFTAEADWWWHHGDYDQVIRCHEMALFFDPTYPEDYAIIAWMQWSLGRDQAAIRALKRGVAAAPTDPQMYFNLGFHYFNTHRESLACEPLRRAVELGGDVLCRRLYAHCLEHLGQLPQALAQWNDMLRLDPDDGLARVNRDRVQALVVQAHEP